MSFELKDKVVVITGAAGGIGSQVVRKLVKENVKASDFHSQKFDNTLENNKDYDIISEK